MTVLRNTIHIQAPPEQVWDALARLDALHEYDPGISKSVLRSEARSGVGADRHCDIITRSRENREARASTRSRNTH